MISYTVAMKIGREIDPRAVQKKHWEQFAEKIGIKPKLVLSRLKELSQKIEAARLPLFKSDFAPYRCDTPYQLMELIAEQCRRTTKLIS